MPRVVPRAYLTNAITIQVAASFVSELTLDVLRDTVRDAEMRLRDVVLDHLEEIFQRFVVNTGSPPA